MLGPTLPPELSQCNDVHMTKASPMLWPNLEEMEWRPCKTNNIDITNILKKTLASHKRAGIGLSNGTCIGADP